MYTSSYSYLCLTVLVAIVAEIYTTECGSDTKFSQLPLVVLSPAFPSVCFDIADFICGGKIKSFFRTCTEKKLHCLFLWRTQAANEYVLVAPVTSL